MAICKGKLIDTSVFNKIKYFHVDIAISEYQLLGNIFAVFTNIQALI